VIRPFRSSQLHWSSAIVAAVRRLFVANIFLSFLHSHLPATLQHLSNPQSHINNCITFTMGSIEEKAPAKCPMRLANVGGGGQKVGLHRHNIYILSYWGQCVLTRHVEP
jgi:hypothetical protein